MKNFLLGIFTGILLSFLIGFVFYKKFKTIQTESIKESIENSTYNFPVLEEKFFEKDSLFKFSYVKNKETIALQSEADKKILIVNYWATWCKPCIEEMPYFDSLYSSYKSNNQIKFLCLSDEEVEKVEAFKQKNNFSLPFASYNKKQILPKPLLVEALPTTIIFNLATEKYYKYEGSLNWNSTGAKNFIDNLLKQ